jgi:regulator of sigma E protease
LSIIIAILILFGVIIFHELGHFIAAKACGIVVEEFAAGMGPKIISRKKNGTVYSWRLIPIGGMCVMKGEDEDDHSEGSFQSAKVWKRMIVVAAGPVFNLLLGFIAALIVVFSAGADPCTVVSVNEGSPAEQAGLLSGDLIVSYEGSGISNARELYMDTILNGLPDDTIDLVVERNGERIALSFALDETERYMYGFSYAEDGGMAVVTKIEEGFPIEKSGIQPGDTITSVNGVKTDSYDELRDHLSANEPDGSSVIIGYVHDGIDYTAEVEPQLTTSQSGGFSYNMAREKQDFFTSLKYAFGEIKYNVKSAINSLKGLFNGTYGVDDLSGPVGIVSTVGSVYEEAASYGVFSAVMSLLNMVILLSVSVGIVNLLPLPALDGGRLIFLIIECIRRKPCSQKIEGAVHFAGFAVLMLLAVFIAFNDVIKLM